MTQQERRDALRRLRFPSPLEDAFRRHYLVAALPLIRLFCLFYTLLQIVLLVVTTTTQETHLSIIACLSPILPLALLALTYHPRAYRFWHFAVMASLLFLGWQWLDLWGYRLSQLDTFPNLLVEEGASRFASGICGFVVLTFLIARLRVLWAALTTTAFLIMTTAILYRGAPIFLNTLIASGATYNVLLTSFACLIGALMLERAQRESFLNSHLLEVEHQRSETLLLNILPGVIAERLKQRPETIADSFAEVTVLFADIVDFTSLAARCSPEQTVALLNRIFSAFDALAEKYDLEKIKTIGDAYMVVGGLPQPREDHAEAVMALALEMMETVRRFRQEENEPLDLRIGISVGPVVAGVIGTKRFLYDLWGDTVNMASRMQTSTNTGCIQVTEEAYQRLCHSHNFAPPQEIMIKGRGTMQVYVCQEG